MRNPYTHGGARMDAHADLQEASPGGWQRDYGVTPGHWAEFLQARTPDNRVERCEMADF